MSRIVPQPTSLVIWQQLLDPSCALLLKEISRGNPEDVSFLQRLRRDWSAELVRASIELTRARAKAREKFPDATDIVSDVTGMEQATSALIASHKARRFSRLKPDRIVDLCCGIGGDAMSLQKIAPVLAVDVNPLRTWMTQHNARCDSRVADVESLSFSRQVFHLDPARRDERVVGRRRLLRYEDYRPGPDYILRLLCNNPDGAIKLGPGIDFEALPDLATREIEVINESGTLTQAILWTGRLAMHPGRRTATRLPDGQCLTGIPEPIPMSEIAGYIFAVDPAIERAELMGTLARQRGIGALHPKSGLLTADEFIECPWLTAYEVEAEMPWRKRKIKQWLREHRAGEVVIRTRGKVVDPDPLQKEFSGSGDAPYTVFIQRFDQKVRAILCRLKL